MAAIWGSVEKLRILCGREFQNSIKESFHAELKAAIESEPWLSAGYDVGIDYLRHRITGAEFLFKGLRHSINTLKSTSGIDLTILEEAEDIPENSWLALEATVFRQPKSELWSLWNPRNILSPVDKRFRGPARYKSALIAEVNWQDNPFFPENLNRLREEQQRTLDPDTYHHVWEGGYLTNSNRQVFGGRWEVMDFTPEEGWDGPYYGGDFGFAQDPAAGVKCWVAQDHLFIEYEAGRVGLELDDTAEFMIKGVPGIEKHVSRWDSARPESISYLRRKGLPRIEAVEKWKGSVEDGVQHMRSYKKIIVHPRCVETQREMRLYSHKVDRLTQDIMPDIVDEYNHYIDAIRYAISPLIKRAGAVGMLFSKRVLNNG